MKLVAKTVSGLTIKRVSFHACTWLPISTRSEWSLLVKQGRFDAAVEDDELLTEQGVFSEELRLGADEIMQTAAYE